MFCELQYQTQNKFPFLKKMKLDLVFGPLFGTGNKEVVSVGVQDTVEVYWAFMRSAHAFSRQSTGHCFLHLSAMLVLYNIMHARCHFSSLVANFLK